jgi:hypothetical protein
MRKITTILIIALFLVFCGTDSKRDNETQNTQPKKQVTAKKAKHSETRKQKGTHYRIKDIKFASTAIANQDLVAQVEFEPADDEYIETRFTWFVNDQQIGEVISNILPKEKFKRGDWVFCHVNLVEEGVQSKDFFKSKYVRIAGLPPALNLQPVPAFTVPGVFDYKIGIANPSSADNKRLTFELLSPKDAGIELDPKTGEIQWVLSEKTVEKFGQKVEIKFKVSNLSGNLVASISLDLGNVISVN